QGAQRGHDRSAPATNRGPAEEPRRGSITNIFDPCRKRHGAVVPVEAAMQDDENVLTQIALIGLRNAALAQARENEGPIRLEERPKLPPPISRARLDHVHAS